MTARRSRRVRPQATRCEVTPRDREILLAVGRMGQATTDQIRRLFFGDPSTASRRLAKLTSARLLDVHVCAQSVPNVYVIGVKALQELVADGTDANELHRSRIGRNIDEHAQILNDLRVEFVLAVRGRADVTLQAFHGDLDLRRAAGANPPAYIPDAIVELGLSASTLALVVEVDTGTEGRTAFMSKVRGTVALWTQGARCWGATAGTWRPAVFVLSSGRARGLARLIAEGGGGELWLVAEVTRVREVGILGPVFATAQAVALTPPRRPITYDGALAVPRSEARP